MSASSHYSPYPYSDQEVQERIQLYYSRSLQFFTEQEALRFILGCIDLTTLEGSDNQEKITQLCQKSIQFFSEANRVPSTAAVCLYPPFVAQAKKLLATYNIRVASVAGAFPAGQSPLSIKVEEVKYAINEGADEVDMVISRGKFLEGNYSEVFDEIAAIREACKGAGLKVILETGELQTNNNIYVASQLAIEAGADFIKTSTGKIPVNATPESFLVMMDAIQHHYEKSGKIVGIKPAGGIADTTTAIQFLKLLENVLGKTWLSNRYFRIGASRLADKIFESIEKE